MHFSIRTKATLLIVVIIALVSITSVVFFENVVKQTDEDEFTSRSIRLAQTVALAIDVDQVAKLKEDVLEVYRSADNKVSSEEWGSPEFDEYLEQFAAIEQTSAFETLHEQLRALQDANDVLALYIVTTNEDDGTAVYLVDASYDDVCHPGTFDELDDDDLRIFANPDTGFGPDITNTEEYGWNIGTTRPIYDKDGTVLAYAGVDLSMNDVVEQRSAILLRISLALLAIALVAIALGLVAVNRTIVRPLNRLSAAALEYQAAQSSSSQSYFENLGIRTGDEIEVLADSMTKMEAALKNQMNKMIVALGADYRSVYYVDLDADSGLCYRAAKDIEGTLAQGERFAFRETFERYASAYVSEPFREGFLQFIDPSNIRKALSSQPVIAYRFLAIRNDAEIYEMLRIANVSQGDENTDQGVYGISVCFTDVDAETRDEMAQKQTLSNALSAAEEASKAKTAFLSNMSHEIRTPMNAIIGLGNIALSDPTLTDKTRDHIEKIDESAHHLLGLINDILDVSRIESGRMTLKNELFSFPKLLEQVNVIIGGQCSDKGLNYRCRIIGRVDDYYIGDDMKLRQALINILGNSVKFTPEGGDVTLDVERVNQFDGRTSLRFTMTDSGIGMDESFLPRIFDTFSQEDSSTTNKYGSTGLGMAITKSIVEMMKGSIDVKSKKGEGTTFTVTVTLVDAIDVAKNPSDTEIAPHAISVLVVDDDPVAREHAMIELESVGISAETASSGQEALDLVELRNARRDPFELILVDWKMPEMNGIETARRMRSIVGDQSAIIFLTAYNWDDVHDEAREAGVDSFLSKPLFAANVLDEFRQTLTKRELAGLGEKRKADLTGRRILLAEDVAINAEILIELMDMREVSVDHAENGQLAVQLFESNPEGYYDAVIMDMRMPVMDGLEATATIRTMNRADAKIIPIIALTANAFNEDVQQSLQAGLNAHLSKPVNPDDLYETLENLIRD